MKRTKLLRWLRRNITKTPEGVISPKWLRVLANIMFPLRWVYMNQSELHYDLLMDIYTIKGIKLSGSFIDSLSGIADHGLVYRLEKNDRGVITIRTLTSNPYPYSQYNQS